MTNWQKLLNGEVYNDFSEDLFNRRLKAKKLFRQYNNTDEESAELRYSILEKLLGKIGDNVWIEPEFKCEYGTNILIGDKVYINFDCIILDCARVEIHDNVLIGPRLGIYVANHSINAEERMNGGCFAKPVVVEEKAWIGGDVKIMGGVTIGKGSVIGSGSVVTKSIPSGVIAVGNPCRVLRKITKADKTNFTPLLD